MKRKKEKGWKKLIIACILFTVVVSVMYLRQRFGAHGKESFVPEYPATELSVEMDYETIFLQTGLGPMVAKRLLEERELQILQEVQEDFFKPREVYCESLIGWFTREDKITDYPRFVDLQPGDILVTLATHSAGWRHGHAALVLDENTTVESVMWGVDSTCGRVDNWLDYSNWAVLRVKEATPEMQQEVADFAEEKLCGVPYHLSAGFIGAKAPKLDAPHFGVHCSYLVWYAWNYFGYDLDSDGGRLVTAHDLLHSEQLEVVQLYGMDPREFMK